MTKNKKVSAFNNSQKIVFLSGLPRTGSTLLTAILAQNPNIFTDGSSPVARLLFGMWRTCEVFANESLVRVNRTDFPDEILYEIPRLYYKNIKEKIIVDKDRAWGKDDLGLIKYCSDEPKILIMLRPILEITESFIYFKTKNNDVLPARGILAKEDPFLAAAENAYYALQNVSSKFLFGTYEQLVKEPDHFLKRLYEFWDIEPFQHQYTNIINPRPENDEPFNLAGLHEIRPILEQIKYTVKVPKNLKEYSMEIDEALWKEYDNAKKKMPGQFI
jgi:sulfotransferase